MKQMNSGNDNGRSLLATHHRIHRIGLLSPTSGNLGNAAMQAAMIANLRKRITGVEFLGITLNPEETRRRHGIEAFPLAGLSRPYYELISSNNSEAEDRQTPEPGRIKEVLKKIPVLRSILRFLRNCAKNLASSSAVRACVTEWAHVRAAAGAVRKLDCVVIPGGGTLDDFWGGPWGHPWAVCKWSLLSRFYGVPFLFVSIGKSSLEQPLSRFFVRIALRLAKYRSYRDPDTKIAVQALIDARRDPVYPDLAFSYPCPAVPTLHRNGSEDSRLVIGVSPIAYCDPRSWPLKDERRYAAYVSQMAEVVRWLIKERHRVLFFTTDGPDASTLEDIRSITSGTATDAEAIQTLTGCMEQGPDSLLRGISHADLTIASRLHGIILSHLNTTPVLALSFDRKVDVHMNAVGQQDYCLNIDDLRFDTIIGRFNVLKNHREREAARIRCAAAGFRKQLDLQYDRIFGGNAPTR